MNYPKILVLNQQFISTQNGGITRKNLFAEWPKNRIAFVSKSIDDGGINFSPNYFIIKKDSRHQSRFINKIISFFDDRYYYLFTEEYIKWIKDFNPDIIYAVPDSISFIRFIKKTIEYLDKPYVLHISDDFVKKDPISSIKYFFSLKKLNFEFNSLLKGAAVLFSICEEMSIEYKKRYGLVFHPFFNPVNLDEFKHFTRNEWSNNEPFKMFYAGSINSTRIKSVYDLCTIVEQLNNEGYNIDFDIYSNIRKEKTFNEINDFKGVKLYRPVENQIDIISKLPIYDLLLMPIDFSNRAKYALRLSMSTNTAEYMHSGTPILIYAPKDIAISKYARESNWGHTVSKRNRKLLKQEILELAQNVKKRKELGSRAHNIAITHHSSYKIRKDFLFLINKAIKNSNLSN